MKPAAQQVNLYQPIFRAERKLFSAQAMLVGLALLAAGLVAVWAFGSRQVALLEREVERQRAAEQARLAMTEQRAGLGSEASTGAIEQRAAALAQRLEAAQRALALVRSGGTSVPFSARLVALGTPAADGLWLDRIVFAGNDAGFAGATDDAALVPRYLGELAAMPAFAGSRFDRLVVEREEDAAGRLRFRAGSEAAFATAGQDGPADADRDAEAQP